MALSDIYAALVSNLTGAFPYQSIDLFAATSSDALNSLQDALDLFGISGSYTVENVRLQQDMSSVTLSGMASFSAPEAETENTSSARAVLVCTSPSDVNSFVLSLSITETNWTFARNFPNLPVCQAEDEEMGAVSFVPSFLLTLPFNKPAFTAQNGPNQLLQFAAELPLSSGLEPYADLFAPWPLRTSGTVIMPENAQNPPVLDLFASAPAYRFTVGAIELREMGLQIQIETNLNVEDNLVPALSILAVAGNIYLGQTSPVSAQVSMPLLGSSEYWRLQVQFTPNTVKLSDGLNEVAALFGISAADLPVPDNFVDFGGFFFSSIDLGFWPGTRTGLPILDYVAVSIESEKSWLPGIPFINITNVGTRWLFNWSEENQIQPSTYSGSVYGDVVVGTPPTPQLATPADSLATEGETATNDSFRIHVSALIPSYDIYGRLINDNDETIPLENAFRFFFGDSGPDTIPGMAITDLIFEAEIAEQTYRASAETTMDWRVPLGINVELLLEELFMRVEVTQGNITGGLTGQFKLIGAGQDPDSDPYFTVGAEYTQRGATSGWVFRGNLYPGNPVYLLRLVTNFLGISASDSFPDLYVERLAVSFATGTGAYTFAGTIAGRWTPTVFGQQLRISAVAATDIAYLPEVGQPEGTLSGRFSINNFAVEIGMNLKVIEPTYLFKVEFGSLWLSATTGWHGAENNRHQILSLQLGGVTLGSILEYLVNLAAPTLGFRLDPPWDVLKRIDLSRFTLTIDPTDNTVELVYNANVNLVFMSVQTVGVRYLSTQGEPSVELILTGRFLDKVYTSDDPLAWNVISDPPPSIPGEGEQLLKLRYLGFGQHVTLSNMQELNTVYEVLNALRASMKPVSNPHKNPLDQSSGNALVFAPDSSWLIGLDVSFLETLDLGVVFNDPRLYGLVIGLNGERAGSLSGLRFEILYKKLSNDLGMFRIELQIPQSFRQIEMGEISLTLGIVTVEIYTNGNFLVDLGFPAERDYTRAFTLQVFPFIGRGGIYFGLLNGQTSRRVPAITNGTFDPVLELGIGLSVGVGKEISVGPLSGGIAVEVEVIFQGVLGWFNPNSNGFAPAKYYWGQGIAAISGKLYGKIDFKVVKVSVSLEAYAQATVIFEAYRATHFSLVVRVRAHASVRILFVSVSFSFSVSLNVSFTVGRDLPTPWLLASGQGTPTQARLRANIAPALGHDFRRLTSLLRQHHLRVFQRTRLLSSQAFRLEAAETPYVLNWNPQLPVFSDAPRQLPVTMLPAFSITQVPVNWDGTQPVNADPQYRVSFLLFAPNGVLPDAPNLAATMRRSSEWSAQATTTGELSSDLLIEAFLRWSISAVTGSPGNDQNATVTAGQLQLLLEQMQNSTTSDTAFTTANLSMFFQTNLWFQLSGDPDGNPSAIGGMAMPLPPYLSWTSLSTGERNFSLYNPVGALYEWGVANYLASYFPVPEPVSAPPDDDPAAYEAFTAFVFRDWCLLLARGAVQAALDTLQSWLVTLTTPASLAFLADLFSTVPVSYSVRSGDTVDSVAQTLGATPAELTYLNPTLNDQLAGAEAGTVLQILLGIAPQNVAVNLAQVPLAVDIPFYFGPLTYQVAVGDTLAGIAQRFHLASSQDLFAGTTLADDSQLLRPGATFPVPQVTYKPPDDFSQVLTAAAFYVRYFSTGTANAQNIPFASWYAQTIFDLNMDGELQNITYDQPIPPDITLIVPAALNDIDDPDTLISYTTLPGDTLLRIGASLSLAQNFATVEADEPVPGWPDFRNDVQSSENGFLIPASKVTILSGETVNLLAARTIVNATNLPGLLDWIESWPLLSNLAQLTISNVSGTTGVDGATLAELANHFALSVEELSSQLADLLLFVGTIEDPLELTITDIPVQTIDELVQQVLDGPAPSQISGTSSRYLLAGLRLPAPVDNDEGHLAAEGPLASLYDLTGQQFASPPPDPTQPAEQALEVTLTVNPGIDWIELFGNSTTEIGDTLDSLLARIPRLLEWNPGLRDAARLRPGMVVMSDPVSALTFSYTNEQLQTNYPATGLALLPTSGPSPLPLAEQRPQTYGLDHHIELQSPLPLPIPAVSDTSPVTGNASLWPFSETLLVRALSVSTTLYDLVLASNRPNDTTASETLQNATFATLLPFSVRRPENTSHIYELPRVDAANRQLLLTLWQYLTNQDTPPGTQAFLLLSPAPDAGNYNGVTVLDPNQSQTFVLKTNQTTTTSDLTATLFAETDSQYYASFASLAQFVLLLWESSIVGGVGYYFGFADALQQDLPPGASDDHGNITLYLLLVAGEQQILAPNGRSLLPCNNTALVAPGLDPSTNALYVEAADDSELITVATVQPGNIGLTLTLPVPPTTGSADPSEAQLQQLFSLLTYEASNPFFIEQSGLPVTSQANDGQSLPLWRRQRSLRWRRAKRQVTEGGQDDQYWLYEQVLPVARYGPPSVAPQVNGLPDPNQDPYRGLAGQSLPSTTIQTGFVDVLGNVTAPPSSTSGQVPPGGFTTPVGYTDPLQGVGSWPALTSSYNISYTDDAVTLTATLAAQAGATTPVPGQNPQSAIDLARKQAERYEQIYYQLAQPQLKLWLLSSLQQNAEGQEVPHALDPVALWLFSATNYLATRATAGFSPLRISTTLSKLVQTYQLGYSELASANAAQSIVQLFGPQSSITIPAYIVFAEDDTASSIVSVDRPGWPSVDDGADLLALTENTTLPLRPAIALTIPRANLVVSDDPEITLTLFASSAGTSVAWLASDNATTSNLLQPGFVFLMDQLSVTVGIQDDQTIIATFADVQQAFAQIGINVTIADLAVANGNETGMLQPGSIAISLHYLVQVGETLASNGSGSSPADLANSNGDTPNLFDAGSLIYLGVFPSTISIEPDETDTLLEFAARFACPLPLLLQVNPDLALPENTTFVVPGTVTLPQNNTITVPYTIQLDDTLYDVAARFAAFSASGTPTENLASANLNLPGTLTPGQTISVTVNGTTSSTVTQVGDSFQTVLSRLQAQLASITLNQLVASIETLPGYLAIDGLLVCPPAQLLAPDETASILSPATIASTYGVDAVAFAQINAGLLSLLAEKSILTLPLENNTVFTISIGPNETFNSLLSRCAAQGVQSDLATLVTANLETDFLLVGSQALLPPRSVNFSMSLGANAGPFASPIFPLDVRLLLQRPQPLIDPAFRTPYQDGPVEQADTVIPAPSSSDGQGNTASLTFTAFAQAFQNALPDLRLATGKVAGVTADLWVVDFGSNGIASVAITPGVPMGDTYWPRFFALRPLYNDLVTRLAVPIYSLQDNGQLSPTATLTNYQGIDVEVWARRFLEDMDLLLSAAYASGLYNNSDTRAQSSLDKILIAKQTLTSAIANGLAPVLVQTDSNAQAGLNAAIASLVQQLAVSLLRAYRTDALVQYDAAVTSAWTTNSALKAARLVGAASTTLLPGSADEPQSLPVTVTAPKTLLDQSSSFVTFLLGVPDPSHSGALAVQLGYSFPYLEWNITQVPGVAGYEDSDWLAFVPTLDAINLPASINVQLDPTTVPIPLRFYPATPVLLGQVARPTLSNSQPELSQAALWTYSLTYTHEHAEQDNVLVTAKFNLPTPLIRFQNQPEDVASVLASYIAVADDLWSLLKGFVSSDENSNPTTLANAADTFATLATNIATQWNRHWSSTSATGTESKPIQSALSTAPAQQDYNFRVRLNYRTDAEGNTCYDNLQLTSEQDQPGPTGQWPDIFYRTQTNEQLPLISAGSDDNIQVYTFPQIPPIPAVGWPQLTIEWPNLNVSACQNASAVLAVLRNQQLLDEDNPQTTPAFIYQTPLIEASEPVVPLNTWPQRIDITGQGYDVTSALQAAFQELFNATPGLPITLGMYYGYELVPPGLNATTGLVTYLPVSLYPNQSLSATTSASVSQALSTWYTQNLPATNGGEWVFSLVLYSQLDATTRHPLLSLEKLVYRIASTIVREHL